MYENGSAAKLVSIYIYIESTLLYKHYYYLNT